MKCVGCLVSTYTVAAKRRVSFHVNHKDNFTFIGKINTQLYMHDTSFKTRWIGSILSEFEYSAVYNNKIQF